MIPLSTWIAIALAGFQTPTRAEPDTYDRRVPVYLKDWQVPGCVVAVVRAGGADPAIRPYGRRSTGSDSPVTADTLFPIGSCTKAFTAFLIGTEVDRGTMAWDDPVAKHLPGFRLSDPSASKLVSVRDLLCHRTGIAPHDFLWYRAPWGIDESIRRTCTLPLEKPFRTEMQYQTVMYLAAGRALERAAGRNWEGLFRSRIAEPLGMVNPALTTADFMKAADHAAGHTVDGTGKIAEMPVYELKEPNPAGSLHLSARDLARWMKLLCAGGRPLLKPETFRELIAPQVAIPLDADAKKFNRESNLTSYALGWVVQDYRGKLLVSHAGVIDGYRCHIALLPDEGLAVAVLANSHATRMNIGLLKEVVDRELKLPFIDWNVYYCKLRDEDSLAREIAARKSEANRLKDTLPGAPAEQYVATYEQAAYGTIRISAAPEDYLVWEWGNFRSPLFRFENDSFRIRESPAAGGTVEFDVENRRVKSLRCFGVTFVKK